MDKIEPVERMLCVLDAAIHVHPAIFAGVTLDGRIGIHDLELVGVLGNTQLVARHNRDLREHCARGLPAFGASATVSRERDRPAARQLRRCAAVALEKGKPLTVTDVELDGPKASEVLVEIKATGICHTDEFTLSGADPEGLFPSILGHEGAGVV